MLADQRHALRLTPDEWMIPLFGESDGDGKRDVLEGRLISAGLQALVRKTNVVLDFGFWGRDERSALRHIAHSLGATPEVIYLPIGRDEQLDRIAQRARTTPQSTFPMSEDDVDGWRAQFQEPDDAELAGAPVPPPPAGWTDWWDWAADRWPSLARP